MPNYRDVCSNDNEKEVSLLLFLCNSYEEMYTLTSNHDDIKIIKELDRLSMDEDFGLHYDAEAVRRKTENTLRKKGYEEGIQQGKLNNQKEIIKNMLSKDMNLNDISEIVELSIEEINNLIHESKEA